MVSYGTGIAIQALPFLKRNVDTAFSAGTAIGGAAISIIAGRLIHIAVTVVVDTIARFERGYACIAGFESRFAADP
jgi:hypothetical protein